MMLLSVSVLTFVMGWMIGYCWRRAEQIREAETLQDWEEERYGRDH